jgi:hypothetical protein
MNGIYLPHSGLEFAWRSRGRNEREREREREVGRGFLKATPKATAH